MDRVSCQTEGKTPDNLAKIGCRMANNKTNIGDEAANASIATTTGTADN